MIFALFGRFSRSRAIRGEGEAAAVVGRLEDDALAHAVRELNLTSPLPTGPRQTHSPRASVKVDRILTRTAARDDAGTRRRSEG